MVAAQPITNLGGDSHWSGSDIIQSLTQGLRLFLFAYSPEQKTLLAWSDNSETVLGVKDLFLARDGNLFLRHSHPDDRFLLLSELERALRGDASYRVTYRWIRPDTDQVRWLHCRADLVRRADGEVLEGFIVDLSEEFTGPTIKLTEPDSASTILAAFPKVVFTLDADLRVLRINRPEAKKKFHFGDPEFDHSHFGIGRSFVSCFQSRERAAFYEGAFRELLEEKQSYFRTRLAEESSVYSLEVVPLREHQVVVGLLAIVADISELVYLEQQLGELQKAEGLRLLAAGFAHNFNNSLQGIVGQAALIQSHPDNPKLVGKATEEIFKVVSRASKLTSQLFTPDSYGNDVRAPIDINLASMTALNRIRDFFDAGIKVAVAFGNPALALVQESRLIEALEAIFINARESMPDGGHLTIRSFQVEIGPGEVPHLEAGSYAKLTVSDTGLGMTPEVRARCFEPFYTTKDCDPQTGLSLKGRGLGLSRAFALVREMNGAITIESKPSKGTTVAVILPIHADERPDSPRPPLKRVDKPEILIVDDDLMVLDTARRILEDANYRCVTSDNGQAAIARIEEHRGSLKLILLDLIMPGMDGLDLLKKIKVLNPNLKVIGFSGAPPEQTKSLLEQGASAVIRKPVDPETLSNAVRDALPAREYSESAL